MSLFKSKTRRLNRLNNAWWIDDWSSRSTKINNKKWNNSTTEQPSSIVLRIKDDSTEMIKTKNFLGESLNSAQGIDGTIIIGSVTPSTVPELHEILLNIKPFGWIYVPGGKKDEKQ